MPDGVTRQSRHRSETRNGLLPILVNAYFGRCESMIRIQDIRFNGQYCRNQIPSISVGTETRSSI